MNNHKSYYLIAVVVMSAMMIFSCLTPREPRQRLARQLPQESVVISTSFEETGQAISILFEAGKSFNHPLMAIWVEDLDSNYVQTLYVAQSIASGVFRHGDASTGRWQPGEIRRPAALPRWGHQRGVQASDGLFIPDAATPLPDALTGATPKGDFTLHTYLPKLPMTRYRVLFEINQSWDWNRHWTNSKFPDDKEYKTSSQPAVVYETIVDLTSGVRQYDMNPIGHSHWSGSNGQVYTDLSTLTTAMDIAAKIVVVVR